VSHEYGALVYFKVSILTVTGHLVQMKMRRVQFHPHYLHQRIIVPNASMWMDCPSRYLESGPPEYEPVSLLL
jgi:hypothetical protein